MSFGRKFDEWQYSKRIIIKGTEEEEEEEEGEKAGARGEENYKAKNFFHGQSAFQRRGIGGGKEAAALAVRIVCISF